MKGFDPASSFGEDVAPHTMLTTFVATKKRPHRFFLPLLKGVLHLSSQLVQVVSPSH